MGCKFCATGTMGIIGDLTAGEIIEQLVHASTVTRIRNVVFMGMGEPLNNYENVKQAVSAGHNLYKNSFVRVPPWGLYHHFAVHKII